MRKFVALLATMLAAAALAVVFAGSAAGQQGSGKDCPPDSPGGKVDPPNQAPNCGQVEEQPPPADTCHDGQDNDHDGFTDSEDPECQDPNDGVEDGSDLAPPGNCASADLIVLTTLSDGLPKIVCLYFPPNGNLATEEEECPDALIATGPGPAPLNGGVCIFLPPPED